MADEQKPTVQSFNWDGVNKHVNFQVSLPEGGVIHGNISNVADPATMANAVKKALADVAKAF